MPPLVRGTKREVKTREEEEEDTYLDERHDIKDVGEQREIADEGKSSGLFSNIEPRVRTARDHFRER